MNTCRGAFIASNFHTSHHPLLRLLLCISLLGLSQYASAQFLWRFAGQDYPSKAQAEAALKAHPSPQYLQFTDAWYEEFHWWDPARTLYWYTVFDYQPVSSSQFWGYTVNRYCGFFDGTDCYDTIEDAVIASNSSEVNCDVQFEVGGPFAYQGEQWKDVLEHGVTFWASERAPLRVDFFHWNSISQSCEYGSSANQSIYRTSLATCNNDLSPLKGHPHQWLNPPDYPNICSPGGSEPPKSNIAVISKRITSICTATEGNPCSPMTGHKSLSELDFSSGHLKLERHYNSSLEFGSDVMSTGWSHNYISRLISSGGYSLTRSDGNIEEFTSTVNGNYRSANTPGTILEVTGNLAQVTFRGGRKEIFELLPPIASEPDQFRLIEIYEPELPDRHISLSYIGHTGLLDKVTDQFNRHIQFEYNNNVRISAIVLPGSERIEYSYDTNGNLQGVSYQDGSTRTYLYENAALPNHLTGIMDENNNRYATYDYDQYARVTLSEHAGGAGRVTLNYVADGMTEVTTPSGDIRTYSFDQNRPTFEVNDISDGNGAVTYTRNSDGWQTEKNDTRGHTTKYSYDEYHKTQHIDGFGTAGERTVNYGWDNTINRKVSIDEPGTLRSFIYDVDGRLTSKTIKDQSSGLQRSWSYTYFDATSQPAEVGRLHAIDGPRTEVNDKTTYGYYTADDAGGLYRAGDLHTITNAAGQVTEYLEYDANGRLTKVKDPNNVITTMGYHLRGWITSRTIAGKTTSFIYDNAGNVTRVTQADGSYSDYQYDEAHRLTAIADNFNNRIEYTLDAAGNRVAENTYDDIGVLSRQLSRVYDALNRLDKLIDGNGNQTQYGYDSNGNQTSTLDANLNLVSFEYDPLNRLAKTIDTILGETLMDYDNRDNLVSITDPLGNVTSYTYDGLDNRIQLDSPDTGFTTYEYDSAGNRTAATDARGIRTQYYYDVLNRLTDISHPDPSLDVSFTFDMGTNGKGRLTGMTDAVGTVSYSYDARSNLLSETRTNGVDQYLTSYEYNSADRLTQITYPSGMVIDYTLDSAGRIAAVDKTARAETEVLASNIQYEPFGPVTAFTYGNGLTYSAAFDQDYELEHLQSGAGLDWLFGYDPVGNILTITDQLSSQNSQSFTYDKLHRLETAEGGYAAESFEYDANGNRARYLNGAADNYYTYEPQSNRLATQNNWAFTRDAAGNRTEKLDASGYGQLYAFGAHNRLSQTSSRDASGDAAINDYQYDGKGQRISKHGDGNDIHYIYGPLGELLGEYSSNPDGEYTEYVYLGGQPLAVVTRKIEVASPPTEELILDNGDPGTDSTGSWLTKSSRQDYGDDYSFTKKAANQSYRWSAAPPGINYEVYAWWVSKKNQAENVTYTIGYGTGETDTVVKSHKTGGGQWQLLGSYHSSDGQDFVEVSSAGNKFVADAIRWVEVLEPIETLIETTHFIHFDHLGTPRQVTDKNQTLVWSWDSTPFGDSNPDEDPDGNSKSFILNLRFPGQYYDAESGLHYNLFRTYDPGTGRYIESDPVGLDGGFNTYTYVGMNPMIAVDPLGLYVTGSWIKSPRFNLSNVAVDNWETISPTWSKWGYLKLVRLYGRATGFINLDVKCSDECNEWEVHEKISVEGQGYFDVGPNLYAIIVGLRAGPVAGVSMNVAIGGVNLLAAEHHYLGLANEKAGSIISAALAVGPTGICLDSHSTN